MAGKRAKGLYCSRRWIRLRNRARVRAGCRAESSFGTCERCRQRRILEVHHLVAVGGGGELLPPLEEVEAICRECHFNAHAVESRERARKQGRGTKLEASAQAWETLISRHP